MMRSKCAGLKCGFPSLFWSMVFRMVGYVENTILAVSSFLFLRRLQREISGKLFWNASSAWSTKGVLSAKNS